jgi:hypothetical protein
MTTTPPAAGTPMRLVMTGALVPTGAAGVAVPALDSKEVSR